MKERKQLKDVSDPSNNVVLTQNDEAFEQTEWSRS